MGGACQVQAVQALEGAAKQAFNRDNADGTRHARAAVSLGL